MTADRHFSRAPLGSWNLSLDPARFDYDEAEDRAPLRKGLSQIVRDMDRCLGHPENDREGPSLRALWSIAMAAPRTVATTL